MATEIVVLNDREALAQEGARRVAAAIGAGPAPFALALAGGATPRGLYAELATRTVEWQRVHLFWGDERCVPPDHPESNYRMVRETLLAQVDVPPENVHRVQAERPPAEAAALYAQELAAWGRLDLVLLGLGAEGHTASLFPYSPALDAQDAAVAVYVPALGVWRVTLTPVALCAARAVMFVVAGAAKSAAVRAVLESSREPASLPAQAIRPGSLVWLLDRAAAAALRQPS